MIKANSNRHFKLVYYDYLTGTIVLKHGKRPYSSAFHAWNKGSAIFFSSCVTPFHSHNHIQLVFDTQNNFKFRTKGQPWETHKSLIIKENTVHQLDTNQSVQLIIYVDPASNLGQTLQKEWLADQEVRRMDITVFRLVNPYELQLTLLKPEGASLKNLVEKMLTRLCGYAQADPVDPRVAKVEDTISSSFPSEITIASLANMIHLSESRLRSLFRKTSGMSLYRYMLWHKIRYATNQIMSGNAVNDAAMDAGFTDSSHFHKTMVKIYGMSPSSFLKKNKPKDFMVYESSALPLETSFFDTEHWKLERTISASITSDQSGFWKTSTDLPKAILG